MSIFCNKCGFENMDDSIYCMGCGEQIAMPCPKCGAIIRATSESCSVCGATLSNSASTSKKSESTPKFSFSKMSAPKESVPKDSAPSFSDDNFYGDLGPAPTESKQEQKKSFFDDDSYGDLGSTPSEPKQKMSFFDDDNYGDLGGTSTSESTTTATVSKEKKAPSFNLNASKATIIVIAIIAIVAIAAIFIGIFSNSSKNKRTVEEMLVENFISTIKDGDAFSAITTYTAPFIYNNNAYTRALVINELEEIIGTLGESNLKRMKYKIVEMNSFTSDEINQIKKSIYNSFDAFEPSKATDFRFGSVEISFDKDSTQRLEFSLVKYNGVWLIMTFEAFVGVGY